MASTERPTPVTVRRGDRDDAPAVATLHATQISEGFLSFLGPEFLVRLYRRITAFSSAFLLVAEREGAIVGFVAGSSDVPGLYRHFLLRDGVQATLGSVTRLVPRWRHVLETLRHGSSGVGAGRGVELLAIAVDGSQQGRGVGRSLVGSFLDEVARRGSDAAYVVVAADNAPAVALYQGAGFAGVQRVELHAGATSLLMQWDAPDAAPSNSGLPPP